MSQAIGNTSLAYARAWHKINLKDQVLGRIATQIAVLLMGKHKPIFDPAADCGDYVVLTNASQIKVTGNKLNNKLYRSHTGYAGGFKEIPYKTMLAKNPEKIIYLAVKGMLPKNRTRDDRLNRLLIFKDNKHPYDKNFIHSYVDKTNNQFTPSPLNPKFEINLSPPSSFFS